MKRSTLIMLGVFVALLVVYVVATRDPVSQAPAPLSIDGYIGNVSEQEARSAVNARTPPVTRISLQRNGETIVLDRTQAPGPPAKPDAKPTDPQPAEAKWVGKRTKAGKTTQSKVQAFRAQTMSETLMRSIRSSHSVQVKPDQLGEYGLGADQAIAVELTLPERTVKLRVGQLDKADQGDPNTWVQDPARPDVVFQVPARDLRTSFDVTWNELRDRSVLTLDLAKVERLVIENPADPRAKKVVAERAPQAAGSPPRDANEGWRIVEPAGVAPGDLGDWLKAIERFSVSEFVDAAELVEKKVDTGLDDPKTAARVTVVAGGELTTLVFGKTLADKPNKETYARIEGGSKTAPGAEGEVYLVAGFSRDQIVQTLDQLRDRSLFAGRKGKDITGFTLTGGKARLVAARTGETWALTEPSMRADSKAIADFLTELETVKVDFLAAEATASNGLDAPEWTLVLQWGGESRLIQLGKDAENQTFGRMGASAGALETFQLSTWNAGRVKKTATDFADKHLLPIAKADMIEVWWTPATGPALHLVRGAEGAWQVDSGPQKAAAKPEAADAYVAALADLVWTAQPADKTAAGVGLDKAFSTLRVRSKAGQEAEVRLSTQTGEDVYAQVVVAGRPGPVLTMAATMMGGVQKTFVDLAK